MVVNLKLKVMKKFVFSTIAFVCFSFGVISCTSDEESLNNVESSTKLDSRTISLDDEIAKFEKSYIQNYSLSGESEVRLIGFKTMKLEEGKDKEVVKWVSKKYQKEIAEMKGLFIAPDFSFYRVYFPMHTAIVDFMGKEYKANEKGIIDLSLSRSKGDISSIEITGRVKSDKVVGCGSNIITPDKIILKDKLVPCKSENNTLLFDMGLINCCEESGEMRSTPCTQNHQPYANCSDAFGIWGDNCVTRRDVCMDFNGYGSDCVKGPKTYFIGSDCQKAMLQGHCWNEIM